MGDRGCTASVLTAGQSTRSALVADWHSWTQPAAAEAATGGREVTRAFELRPREAARSADVLISAARRDATRWRWSCAPRHHDDEAAVPSIRATQRRA
eukprot:CAMPEP_0203822350 /NCGR_PEP_ID=MMETSP0115-20131106/45899_1 /ASSEMBLY_ACC=CAM_ASM_000227 /TAXON_ID=33651 /ORGANISM="Bicosoecid sp, Strain ms1" /LENGTH=97 /DNA_ID=CAMNT_0050731379 /DNA_START=95 /DNA_END=384 /DNA_ORIENTATION=-